MTDETRQAQVLKHAQEVVKEALKECEVSPIDDEKLKIKTESGTFVLYARHAGESLRKNGEASEKHFYFFQVVFPNFCDLTKGGVKLVPIVNRMNEERTLGKFYIDDDGDITSDVALLLEEGEFNAHKFSFMMRVLGENVNDFGTRLKESNNPVAAMGELLKLLKS